MYYAIHAERDKYIQSIPEILEYNFLQFTCTFTQQGSKLERRKRPLMVKTYPNYSSNPQNENYGLFCKYQLLNCTTWEHTPDNAWNNLEQCDDTYKTCWINFLCSDCAKALVPDWEIKLQNLNASVKLQNEDLETEANIEQEKEEWMLMSELNLHANMAQYS